MQKFEIGARGHEIIFIILIFLFLLIGDRVTFSLVHIELPDIANCSDAYLSVYEGISLDSPKIGQYCSRTLPHRITSQGNALTIRLHMAGYYPMASGIVFCCIEA